MPGPVPSRATQYRGVAMRLPSLCARH